MKPTPTNIERLAPNARRLTFTAMQLATPNRIQRKPTSDITDLLALPFGEYTYPHPLRERLGAFSGHEPHCVVATSWTPLMQLLERLWNTRFLTYLSAQQSDYNFDSADWHPIYIVGILRESEDGPDEIWTLLLEECCGVAENWAVTYQAFT